MSPGCGRMVYATREVEKRHINAFLAELTGLELTKSSISRNFPRSGRITAYTVNPPPDDPTEGIELPPTASKLPDAFIEEVVRIIEARCIRYIGAPGPRNA